MAKEGGIPPAFLPWSIEVSCSNTLWRSSHSYLRAWENLVLNLDSDQIVACIGPLNARHSAQAPYMILYS